MPTIVYNGNATVYSPLNSTVTVTPGTGTGRVTVRGQTRGGVEFVNRTITAAIDVAMEPGSSMTIACDGISATYSGDVEIQTVDGGVVALSEVTPEVLANPTATTTVLTGAGVYFGYRCTTAIGNITVYDNTAASGKVLVPTTALALGSYPIFGAGNPRGLQVTTGVTVVLSGAGVVYAGVEAA